MIDADGYKAVMRNLASGVCIVTTAVDGQRFGMTATSFTSVSLDPMLVQVSLDKESRTHDAVKQVGLIGVSILGAHQEQIARSFSTKGIDRFEDCSHSVGQLGMPLIDDAIGTLECRVIEVIDGGDHTIFVAEVLEGATVKGTEPLVYFQGDYRGLGN